WLSRFQNQTRHCEQQPPALQSHQIKTRSNSQGWLSDQTHPLARLAFRNQTHSQPQLPPGRFRFAEILRWRTLDFGHWTLDSQAPQIFAWLYRDVARVVQESETPQKSRCQTAAG